MLIKDETLNAIERGDINAALRPMMINNAITPIVDSIVTIHHGAHAPS